MGIKICYPEKGGRSDYGMLLHAAEKYCRWILWILCWCSFWILCSSERLGILSLLTLLCVWLRTQQKIEKGDVSKENQHGKLTAFFALLCDLLCPLPCMPRRFSHGDGGVYPVPWSRRSWPLRRIRSQLKLLIRCSQCSCSRWTYSYMYSFG
jgi:hypothetical protein